MGGELNGRIKFHLRDKIESERRLEAELLTSIADMQTRVACSRARTEAYWDAIDELFESARPMV